MDAASSAVSVVFFFPIFQDMVDRVGEEEWYREADQLCRVLTEMKQCLVLTKFSIKAPRSPSARLYPPDRFHLNYITVVPRTTY